MATIFSEETRRNSTLRRTRFEMWVGIEEDGRRTAVQIKDKVGCTTGGVFKLRQVCYLFPAKTMCCLNKIV